MPAQFLAEILELSLPRREGADEVMLLDGFPRQLDQVQPIEKIVRSSHPTEIESSTDLFQTGTPCAVFYFNCPQETARYRVTHRQLLGRDRDEALFDRRYAEFRLKNPAIESYYRDLGLLTEARTRIAHDESRLTNCRLIRGVRLRFLGSCSRKLWGR